MNLREEYLAIAVLIFVIGLLASLMIPCEYIVPMAITIAVIPLWTLLKSAVDHIHYLIMYRRYTRRIG